MKVLRSRLYEIELNKRMESDSQKEMNLLNQEIDQLKLEPIIIHKEELLIIG